MTAYRRALSSVQFRAESHDHLKDHDPARENVAVAATDTDTVMGTVASAITVASAGAATSDGTGASRRAAGALISPEIQAGGDRRSRRRLRSVRPAGTGTTTCAHA